MSIVSRFLFPLCLLVASSLASAAFPNLKLPFPGGETWKVTRLYNDDTHRDYGGDYSDDKYAIDFALGNCNDTYGKTILAAASGTVKSISRTEIQTPTTGYGNSIVIDHGDGYSTRYAHLKSIEASVAREGAPVNQGQKIGKAGGTGYVIGTDCNRSDIPSGVRGVHLHFVLYRNGNGVKPEPMDGITNFVNLSWYMSNNSQQSSAASVTALSCIYPSSTQQFCWRSNSTSNALCQEADAWVLYDYGIGASYSKSSSDCPAYCVTSNKYCRNVGGSHSVDGFGVGGGDNFNLKVNNFWMLNASGVQLTPDVSTVTPGQVVTVKVQVKALNGSTSSHMRPGKSTIEIDFYVREDDGEWVFVKREYIQATNLPSGATHTESIDYTVPQGVNEVSFKAKIDAEDEAYEANEGDNWTEIQTFQMDFSWLIPIINLILED